MCLVGERQNAKMNQNGKYSGKYLKFGRFECSDFSRCINLLWRMWNVLNIWVAC